MEEIVRDKPEPAPARKDLVKKLNDQVIADIKYWQPDFDRMKANRKFARGLQWPGTKREDLKNPDRPYVANITMRHLKQRTAATYARNPKFIWHRTQRLYHQLWDGTAGMLQQAMAMVQPPAPAPADPNADPAAAPVAPAAPVAKFEPSPIAMAILKEAADYAQQQQVYEKIGKTIAFLYEWSLREQTQPTKRMMKRTVLQAGTCGVGYVKQTYQRTMQAGPDKERKIHDAKSQLATIMRISQELQADEIRPEDPEVARLQILITNLEEADAILLREGLALDYPDPLNIIPSQDLIYLPGFVGCPYVTERYFMSPNEVKEIYGVDLKEEFKRYQPDDPKNQHGNRASYSVTTGTPKETDCAMVMEVYHKADGVVYEMVDGYCDFLREPKGPFPWTERFYPWFVFAPNAMDDPDNPFPPSDVELIEPMQMEINRAGEGLREHRIAARPGMVIAGQMAEEDRVRLEQRRAHTVVALQALEPGVDIKTVLQGMPTSPIDPNLYDTNPQLQDIMRSTGTQEANLGPTSGATATESSIAQSSRQSTDDSTIDELDDLLTELGAAGAQILFLNMTEETVKAIAGPGAMWPDANKEQIAKEIYLEVEAGSSGRKNQAHEVQVRTQMYPFMMQTPGLSVEWLQKDMLRVMDSRINYEDAIDMTALSITSMNAQAQQPQQPATKPGADPKAQGPQGAANAPTPQPAAPPGPQPPPTTPLQ